MEKLLTELESGDFGSTGLSAARLIRSMVDVRDRYKQLYLQKEKELNTQQQELNRVIRQRDMMLWITQTAKPGDWIFAISDTRIKEATICAIEYTPENKLIVHINFECDNRCGGCPFKNTWNDYVSGEGGCDGEWGSASVECSELGVSLFYDRAVAEQALAEKIGNPRLEDTLVQIQDQDGKKVLHFFGYAYESGNDDTTPFRWVEYCGFEVDLAEAIQLGAKNFENQNGSEVKQYLYNMAQKDIQRLLTGELHPIIISDNLTEDVPCGTYWLR